MLKISQTLSLLFNKITSTVKFPNCWKLGFFTQVKKKGSKQDFDGFQSIAFTPLFSKLYESFLVEWLKAKIIPNVEHLQFRNLFSTSITHYLVHLMDTKCNTLEKLKKGEWGGLNTWVLICHLFSKNYVTATECEKLHHKHAMKKW